MGMIMSDSLRIWKVWCHFGTEPAYVEASNRDAALANATHELPGTPESALIVYEE